MRTTQLGIIFVIELIAAIACSVVAARACEPPGAMLEKAAAGAAKAGGKAEMLEGLQAKTFLQYINTRVGDPTDYRGDEVVVAFYPKLSYALVGLVIRGCAQEELIKLDAESFRRAYQAAYGVDI